MAGYRLSINAERELEDIWLYLARESGNPELATRVVDDIVGRFWLLARHPFLGRKREDLAIGLRSLTAEGYVILHEIAEDGVVFILHIVHGNRDIAGYLRG